MNSLQQQPDDTGSNAPARNPQRVIRPTRSRNDWPRSAPDDDSVRRLCVIDVETTGIDVDRHLVIEICAAIVLVNGAGRIVGVESIGTGVRDPGQPLSREIRELTGLTDADLAGKEIARQPLIQFIETCDGVVAFNAGFDRPHVEKLLPELRPLPWGCVWRDVRWRQLGFEPGPQGYLLMQAGCYNPSAHRAQDDVLALIELLDHVCNDGESVAAKVMAGMDAPAWRFEAANAAYGYRTDLREQRYRWAAERTHRLWHKHVRQTDFRDEYDWYKRTIGMRPVIVPLPASERYRAERTWAPASRSGSLGGQQVR